MSIHICYSRGYYIGQVRGYGCKLWRTVTGRCKTPEGAMKRAAQQMNNNKRARVLFVDNSGWYEPTISMECNRR